MSAQTKLLFGRLDSDYTRRPFAVNIDAQNAMPIAVYLQLVQLTSLDLPITQDEFVRMWKTLLLKRCQDVFEMERSMRPDHFIRLNRNIAVPAPLADLLFAIGSHHCPADGVIYEMIPPDRPAAPPNFWTTDAAIVANWQLACNRMQHLFTMKEYPAMTDFKERPIMLTSRIVIDDDYARIVAHRNTPTPADAMLRLIHDELFVAPLPGEDGHLRMCDILHIAQLRGEYLRSYCKASNA